MADEPPIGPGQEEGGGDGPMYGGVPAASFLKSQPDSPISWMQKQLLQLLIQTIVAPSIMQMRETPTSPLKIPTPVDN